MPNALFTIPAPYNEPVKTYSPGSIEKKVLKEELSRQFNQVIEIPLIIGGKEIRTGRIKKVVCPHDHQHVLANYHEATENEVNLAIESALKAKKEWQSIPLEDRAAIFIKAVSLLSTKYRYIINAATMLGQSKSVHQAEIDSVCETADFLRFNAKFAEEIYEKQPASGDFVYNRIEYRPLEGFILAISPFNFTAIGANLAAAPAIMGNTVVWKPASTALLSNYYLMELYKEAGLPDGVINFVPGSGSMISKIVLNHPELAGIHFTGSTRVFNSLWKGVADNLSKYKVYPRLVGETGGKDFIFIHSSADAVVGQQPFGGARASGTNDKAGSYLNLIRWVSPRTIKECFTPPIEWKYSFMEEP